MKLQAYEILSHVIPGYIPYAILLIYYPALNFDALPSIGIAFFFGYIINALSSILEPLFYALWGGKPSQQLLQGRGKGKAKVSEWLAIQKFLEADYKGNPNERPTTDDLFSVALRHVNHTSSLRISNFSASFALSRSMLTCCFFLLLIGSLVFYSNLIFWACTLPTLLLVNYRTKQRGYYFAKEVLNEYLMLKVNQEDSQE